MRSAKIAFKAFLLFTILTGVVYPLLITGITQVMFPEKANGSLIREQNRILGSKLIGQQFDSIKYFSSRPSVINYNPVQSGASNYGLTNAKLRDSVRNRYSQFIYRNKLDSLTTVPSEMLFASASGLDPHISPDAAFLQVERIAQARNYSSEQKKILNTMKKN